MKWLALLLVTTVVAPGGHNRTVPHRTLRHCTAHHRHHCRHHRTRRPRPYRPRQAPVPQPAPAPTATAGPVAIPTPTAAPVVTPAPTPFPQRTSVTMDDTRDPWTLVPARFTLGAGKLTFTAYNYGMDDHNLSVDSASRTVHYGSVGVPAGSSDDPPVLSVELPPGRYVLFCNLPGHEAAGMSSTITVQ